MSELLFGLVTIVLFFHAMWLQRRMDKLEAVLGRLNERRTGGKYLN